MINFHYLIKSKGRFLKKNKEWMDLSNAHLAPASQAEGWVDPLEHNIFFSKKHFFLQCIFLTIPLRGRSNNMLKNPFDNYIN